MDQSPEQLGHSAAKQAGKSPSLFASTSRQEIAIVSAIPPDVLNSVQGGTSTSPIRMPFYHSLKEIQ